MTQSDRNIVVWFFPARHSPATRTHPDVTPTDACVHQACQLTDRGFRKSDVSDVVTALSHFLIWSQRVSSVESLYYVCYCHLRFNIESHTHLHNLCSKPVFGETQNRIF